jgi:heavy metal translocating P-type ATPase
LAAELSAESTQHEARLKGTLTLCFLLSMAVMMFSLFLYAEDVYGPTNDIGMARLREVYRLAAAILSSPVLFLCGIPLLRRGLGSLRRGHLTMELLVATGAMAAYVLSVSSILRGGARVYFDSAVSALILSTLGRYLEASARAKASQVLGPSLIRVRESVLAFNQDQQAFVATPPSALQPGTRLRIGVEQTVPVDAGLVASAAEFNLAVLTGESAPRLIQAGGRIPAGAVPVSGPVECIALRSARESTLERLAELARRLREQRSGMQRWADRFASVLTPAVVLCGTSTFAFWATHDSIAKGTVTALAVVLAACPCTYGVTVPLVLWMSVRRALEEGVLIRNAEILESLAQVRVIAFDKTGTLTSPRLAVRQIECLGSASKQEVLALAAAMEDGSPHPVARAIFEAGQGFHAHVSEREFIPGRGVIARDTTGARLALGAPALVGAGGFVARVGMWRDDLPLARFEVTERIRPDAPAALANLKARGVRSLILTGDSEASARPLAESLGLPYIAHLAAEEKVSRLEALGDKIAMVGDGLNDAPALAKAVTSFAMGEGSDLARGMSGVTLLRPNLELVPWTLSLARRTMRAARQSLAISTLYNLIFVGLAAVGALRPVWAGLSMLTSSLLMLALAHRAAVVPHVPEAGESG